MTPTQKQTMQQALDDLVLLSMAANIDHAERPSLADPVVNPQKPECYKWEEYSKWGKGWGWDTCETEYDPRLPENAQYHKGTDFNDPEQVRNFRALYASPPTEVPLLSDQERMELVKQSVQNGTMMDLITATEQAVRQNAGLK